MQSKALAIIKELRGLFIVAAIIFPFRSSIADWNDVPTGSMIPTIVEGDRIAVNKLAYDFKIPFTTTAVARWDNPRRGDIVVLYAPDDGMRLVKRVVGVPGDIIALNNNRLSINGVVLDYRVDGTGFDAGLQVPLQLLTEQLGEHAHRVQWMSGVIGARRNFAPVRVPRGYYFVMGDNRDNSRDSRSFGFVARDNILGRAYAVALSLDPERHYAPRWERFFTTLN